MTPLLLLLPLIIAPSDTLSQTAMQKLLPQSLNQWTVSESARAYSGKEIFKYMNGAGEVYLAYGFHRLLVQRYARPGQEEILVELFDMELPRNAFGAFTNMQGRGPAVGIGQDGEYKSGLLTFWKGRFFVCVLVDNENEEVNKTVLEMGKQISAGINEEAVKPVILQLLPQGDVLPGSLRYLYRHEILNLHYYVSDKNLFHLNDKTEAVLVRMQSDKSYLLLIQYPKEGEAEAALAEFTTQYMPDAHGSNVIQTENRKWTGCIRQNTFLLVVFDAGVELKARELLETVRRRLQ
ncbi:MAG: DUF6599 family protein [bacterium]